MKVGDYLTIKVTQFKKIMKSYEQKQINNHHLLMQRKKEVYAKIPKIKQIDEEMASTGIQIAKLMIERTEDSEEFVKKLKERTLELSMKKIELLHVNNYPKDYLQKIYDCSLCNDTGFIHNKYCKCFKQSLINIAYEQSNLLSVLEKENFSKFSFSYYSNDINNQYGISPLQNIKNVYNYCIKFLNTFNTHFSNIILYGNTGIGKTFLSNCIAKEILDKGFTVIYLTAFQLFDILERYKFNKSPEDIDNYNELASNILSCDLLIIDDLGTEFSTTFTNAQLFNCLNTRLLNKKSTIISTNLAPLDWSKHYSNRVVSRIFGNYEPLHIFGDDIRIKKVYN